MTNQIDITANVVTLGTPAKVTTFSATPGDGQVTINWAAPDDGGSPLTGYKLYRSVSGGAYSLIQSPGAGDVQYINTGLSNGTSYSYQIIASNANGDGPVSDPANAIPNAGTATAAIEVKRSDIGVAPEGMVFLATTTGFDTPGPTPGVTGDYDPQFHELQYTWDFGDPGKTFTKPAHILDEHRDANKMYGPVASHTYTAPNTYTVGLTVYEPSSGKTATTSVQVTVADPAVVFPTTKTVFVDPDSDYTNAPAGAQTVNTFDAAMSAVGFFSPSKPANDYYRIILNDDKEYEFVSNYRIRDAFKNLYIIRSGTGTARPILNAWMQAASGRWAAFEDDTAPAGYEDKKTDIVFSGIEARGKWDSATETASQPDYGIANASFFYTNNTRSTYTLFNDCVIGGYFTCISHTGNSTNVGQDMVNIINDCSITDWMNFGIYTDTTGYFGVTGTSITSKLDAASGGLKYADTQDYNNWHGPIRMQGAYRVAIDACDFFSRSGWFENSMGLHTVQPAMRICQAGNGGDRVNIQRSHAESPGTPMSITPADGSISVHPLNIIVDGCYVVSGWSSNSPIEVSHGGVTIRNNVIIAPAFDRAGVYGAPVFSHVACINYLKASIRAPYTDAAPQKAYNNTFVVPGTLAQNGVTTVPTLMADPTAFTDVTVQNNLDYFPNLPTGAPHPIKTDVLFTARYDGYRSLKHPVQGTLSADVAQGQSFTIPYGSFGGGVTGASDFDLVEVGDKAQPRLGVDGIPQKPNTQGSYGMDEANFTVSTDGTGVIFTNDGAQTWANGANYTAVPIRSSIYYRSEYATPSNTIINASPSVGSSALGAANPAQAFSYRDILGNVRNATTPSLGAFEGTYTP